MRAMKTLLAALALAVSISASAQEPSVPASTAAARAPWMAKPGIYAVFKTGKGAIACRLFPEQTPKTVANFVGLAEGTKDYVDPRDGKAKRGAFYDGTKFHRVIPGFMIQGGDPLGTGAGGPGYEFDDEVSTSLTFSRSGLLAMANAGLRPDGHGTNGSQFFITDVPRGDYDRLPRHLNGHHTIFGEVVDGEDVVGAIADVPTKKDSNGLAVEPVVLEKVEIVRVGEPKEGTMVRKAPSP